MNIRNNGAKARLLGLVGILLLAALTVGCTHHNEHGQGQRDRYGYYQTRDTEDNPGDNAAIRHERRGHNRWRP